MPRAFSEMEKQKIRTSLVDAVLDGAAESGLRALSVDSLVRRAGISKGAFYQFYPSKEHVIFDAIRTAQEGARRDVRSALEEGGDIEPVIRALFGVFARYPIFRELAVGDNLAILLRGLPQDVIDEEFQSDEIFFAALFQELIDRNLFRAVEPSTLTALPRLVLAMELQKRLIGLERYDAVRDLVISGLALTLQPPFVSKEFS